jgi:hypothetical protein
MRAGSNWGTAISTLTRSLRSMRAREVPPLCWRMSDSPGAPPTSFAMHRAPFPHCSASPPSALKMR